MIPGKKYDETPTQFETRVFNAGVEAAISIVQSEEELDGDIPETMVLEVMKDPERVLRSVVRVTKQSITNRLVSAKLPGEREGGQ